MPGVHAPLGVANFVVELEADGDWTDQQTIGGHMPSYFLASQGEDGIAVRVSGGGPNPTTGFVYSDLGDEAFDVGLGGLRHG